MTNQYGNLTKCPIDGCTGFYTTTSNPNINKHIRSRASQEALLTYLLGEEIGIHAKYLKDNMTLETYSVSKISIDDKKQVFLKLGIKK